MSNINNEFEQYWEGACLKDHYPIDIMTDNVKEFCREMYIDLAVKERERLYQQFRTKKNK